jgi:signal-transduction protein with cAMP-binding, CBS, and nucleotidyltransferase domain
MVGSTLSEPVFHRVKNTTSGSGVKAVDRHLVQVTRTRIDGAESSTGIVNITLQNDRTGIITTDDMRALLVYAAATLLSAVVAVDGGSSFDGAAAYADVMLGKS